MMMMKSKFDTKSISTKRTGKTTKTTKTTKTRTLSQGEDTLDRSRGRRRTAPKEIKSRKPASLAVKNKDTLMKNTFSQQNYPAWRPIMNCGTSVAYVRYTIVFYLLMAVALFMLNYSVVEYRLDYTDCCVGGGGGDGYNDDDDDDGPGGGQLNETLSSCRCSIDFNLTKMIPANVYLYYSLRNYYQNFLAYSTSIDPGQINGMTVGGAEATCGKLFTIDPATRAPLAPCGQIANTLFNDTFRLVFIDDHHNGPRRRVAVPLNRTQISWKFAVINSNPHPADGCGTLACTLNHTAKPYNWRRPLWLLDTHNEHNNAYENEHFAGWIRVAPFSLFRKLYARVVHRDRRWRAGLPAGRYQLTIDYNYPVRQFKGRKYLILSNTSLLGGQNYFLAYLFLVTAIFLVILQFVFMHLHAKYDHIWYEFYSSKPRESTKKIKAKTGGNNINSNNNMDKSAAKKAV